MKQSRVKLSRAIADKTLKKGVSKAYAKEVAAYLLAENRVSDLDSVLRDVQADWAEAGHVEVLASSAHHLTPELKSRIEREVKKIYPGAKTIAVREIEDTEIIGGVRLNLPNQQLDMSIEAKLNKFKQLTTAGKD